MRYEARRVRCGSHVQFLLFPERSLQGDLGAATTTRLERSCAPQWPVRLT